MPEIEINSEEVRPLKLEEDIVTVRTVSKRIVSLLNLSLTNQTKIVTAASELARNVIEHGNGGEVHVQLVSNGMRSGIRLVFKDTGPGIANIEEAMRDGFSSKKGMGLGLGGAKRLSDEFTIESDTSGTCVTITKWAN